MTRPLATKVIVTKVSLCALSGLLLLTGCSGSRLGDTLGQSLEPDPQLAEEGSVAAQPTDEPVVEVTEIEDDKPDAEQKSEAKAPEVVKNVAPTPAVPKVVAGEYTDLGKAPEEIQPYLVDLIELGLLEVRSPTPVPASTSNGGDDEEEGEEGEEKAKPPAPVGPNEFRPNQATTRREYARWLLATNNRFYADQRTRKVRPGVNSSAPVFKDVPISDPDFAPIQGLAEAGIVPSPLTGSSTTLTFRPDAPLTREDLLLWKVPLDTRQPLPQSTPTAVEEAWSFQDASKIEPRALQAVLADYQNGDFANIRRAFSYTTLFQPKKAATRSEAAAVLWRFGNSTEGITAEEIRGAGGAEPVKGD